jgi:hypothetical protein
VRVDRHNIRVAQIETIQQAIVPAEFQLNLTDTYGTTTFFAYASDFSQNIRYIRGDVTKYDCSVTFVEV